METNFGNILKLNKDMLRRRICKERSLIFIGPIFLVLTNQIDDNI